MTLRCISAQDPDDSDELGREGRGKHEARSVTRRYKKALKKAKLRKLLHHRSKTGDARLLSAAFEPTKPARGRRQLARCRAGARGAVHDARRCQGGGRASAELDRPVGQRVAARRRALRLGAGSGQPVQRAWPSVSPFAPKSSRVARALLLDPERWWVQKELAEHTDLDAGRVSRVVRRLDDDELLARDGSRLRPRDPGLLLDAWSDDYRFDRHDIITGQLTGSGVELARELHQQLDDGDIEHAFTGLPAAWALDQFARFRLVSVYVTGDPRTVGDAIELRRNERGANVQLIGPDDRGVFDGQHSVDGLPCVAPVQVYLDLGHLPERASEAAEQLRVQGRLWHAAR